MLNNKIYIIVSIISVLFTSCRKDLDVDYNSVTPLYVVEAYVTNEGCHATVTKTQNVEATDSAETVDDAVIMVTGSDGSTITLAPQGNGKYSSDVKGRVGVTYNLTARMGDVVTTASSTMQDSVIVDSCYIFRQDIVERPTYTYEMTVRDSGEVLRDYYICLYRDGKAYKWTSHQNKQSFDGKLTMDIICFAENDEAEESNKLRNWLQEGNVVTGTITRVDEDSYSYYSSWKTVSSTYSNPLSNLSNGVLGLFSAQYITRLKSITFEKAAIPVK